MGHSIRIRGYEFPDDISFLSVTYNLSIMYNLAIKNAGYNINSLGEFINKKKMIELRKFFIDLRSELESHPELYEPLNPKSGWGSYNGLIKNINRLIIASYKCPEGILEDWY